MAEAPHRSELETRPNYIFLDQEDALIALLIFFVKEKNDNCLNLYNSVGASYRNGQPIILKNFFYTLQYQYIHFAETGR